MLIFIFYHNIFFDSFFDEKINLKHTVTWEKNEDNGMI